MRLRRLLILILALLLAQAASHSQSTCSPAGCGVSASAIEAHRWPNVRPLQIDDELLYDRDYRQIDGLFTVHSAPNSPEGQNFGAGYTFVTVYEESGEWSRIGDNQWVRSDILSDSVAPSRFAGALLPAEAELPYPVAWTLWHLRGSKTPGGPEASDNPFLYRYTRVYIYDAVEVGGYNWYQIGPNQWVHQFKVAKLLPISRPAEVDTHKWVSVDLYEQVAIAYEGNKPVFATLVSSGLEEWPTNEGVFHVYVRFNRTLMSGAYAQPDFYYLQEVPWTMYFDDQIALHGAYWHDGFGFRRSHGCVNLTVTDAHWLFQWAQSEYDYQNGDLVGPAVYVYSSGDYD
ncbi:MAG: L,D-transpeptidase [Chloroflexota bacterium]|nr:L,D-transpeptidase [Chloroflexota bacterium]MDE2855053.1 L,D-transpeptidase [Chloroflexota bacterium]MDE2946325.1 L,D-transpeptidase [Chloroflexota bacterium]